MYKETYYFPHDSNAGRDPKCAALINDFGMEGYGIYWSIIEILHEQKNGKLEKFPKLIDGLSFELNVKKEALLQAIEAMTKQYLLLQEDENYIWSNRVNKNLQERGVKRQSKIEAGRLGGIKSGISRKTKFENEAVLEANEAVLERTNQRKGKEKKRKEKTNTLNTLSFDEWGKYVNNSLKILLADKEWIEKKQKYYPTLDIEMTIENVFESYFVTEGCYKDRKGNSNCDWKSAMSWQLGPKGGNRVFKSKESKNNNNQEPFIADNFSDFNLPGNNKLIDTDAYIKAQDALFN